MAAVHTLLSWAASMDYEIHQVDIKSAYLYGKLKDDEIIFIRPPLGNLLKGVPPGHALRLNKALYGLKQAGRRWYKTLERILFKKMGFQKSHYDHAVFYLIKNKVVILILFIHVDDITIIGKDLFVIRVFKKNLAKHVELSDGGNIHWLLGIEIQRN